MTKHIQFKMAAKTNIGMVRTNNEDNFQASNDLSDGTWSWTNNELCTLGEKGALLVVADGMGGMNAGEVASEKAIATVRKFFTPAALTREVLQNQSSIEQHLKDTIITADMEIKAESKTDKAKEGMGTTIVMAWLIDDKCHIAWCGDSRAYVYSAKTGLRRLSKDHSYVQELVDCGKISEEDAFHHPDSNIITRSLGDVGKKAVPDFLKPPYTVQKDDIILLCSDGLSGMLCDSEMDEIIRANASNLEACIDTLILAACDAGGHDNITVAACRIVSIQENAACGTEKRVPRTKGIKSITLIIGLALAFLMGGLAGVTGYSRIKPHPPGQSQPECYKSVHSISESDSTINTGKSLVSSIKLVDLKDSLTVGDTIEIYYNYHIKKNNAKQ